MNFFEAQDDARRTTRYLMLLFALAVISLVLMTNGLVWFIIRYDFLSRFLTGIYEYDLEVFLWTSGVVLTGIALSSFYRLGTLKRGGSAVAELMGGNLVVDHDGDPLKRRLLNVVEEMAIASGTPVPPVYLLPEQSINAFAAGYGPADAVIGVTEGALHELNRDQLQGVIAHEFSHILNGDMRINIRLMGVLFGILAMSVIGRIMTDGGGRTRTGGSLAILLMGLGLILIGYLGNFFGRLIKAAVSRQREYLADASAVQFTRNPEGIAGALKRIGGHASGSLIEDPEGEEVSHMLFADGLKSSLFSMLATHPPLEDRIRRIEPSWRGEFLFDAPLPADETAVERVMGFAPGSLQQTPEEAIGSIGEVSDEKVDEAREILSATPDLLLDAAREPYSARAVVYLMLLHRDHDVRDRQVAYLAEHADFGVHDALTNLLPLLDGLYAELRLPLLEIAVGTLRQLSAAQYELFIRNIRMMIRADGRMGMNEWVVLGYVTRNLDSEFHGYKQPPEARDISQVAGEVQVVLSLLAYTDGRAALPPEDQYRAGADEVGIGLPLLARGDVGFRLLNDALDTLAGLHPLRKPRFLKACLATVTADDKVTVLEREVVRVVADAIDCPMPPLIQRTA